MTAALDALDGARIDPRAEPQRWVHNNERITNQVDTEA
jgi:hypothetical protein